MAHLTGAADRIDYWIRRHAIQFYCESHPAPNKSKSNPARDRLVGLSAIGQCLKDQYDALAPPGAGRSTQEVAIWTVKTRMFYARKKLGELINGAEKVRC